MRKGINHGADHLDESADKLRPDLGSPQEQPQSVSDAEKAKEHIQQKHKAEQLLHHAETKEKAEKTINEHKQSLDALKRSKPISASGKIAQGQPRTENMNPYVPQQTARVGRQHAIQKVTHMIPKAFSFFGFSKAA